MGDRLTRAETAALARMVAAKDGGVAARTGAELSNAQLSELGMSGREIREFKDKLAPREVPDYELDLTKMRDPQDVAAEMDRAVPEVDR